MNKLSEACISTMNYLFLRAVTNKENFSETVISELGIYAINLIEVIKNGSFDERFKINCVINRELKEDYIKNIETFKNQLELFYLWNKEIEISEEDWNDLVKYYMERAEYAIKEGEQDEIS